MSEERFDRIDQTLREMAQRFKAVDDRLEELKRYMGVLSEDAIDRIKATREYNGPTKEEFAELKELFGRRLDPLDTLGRDHERRILGLESGRR